MIKHQNSNEVEVSLGTLSVKVFGNVNLGGLPPGSPAEWGWGTHAPIDLLAFARVSPRDGRVPVAGFFAYRGTWGYGTYTMVAVPMGALVALLALPAVIAFLLHLRRRRRASRAAAGCCLACGYDLRATPGRCPECREVSAIVQPVVRGAKATSEL